MPSEKQKYSDSNYKKKSIPYAKYIVQSFAGLKVGNFSNVALVRHVFILCAVKKSI